MQPLVSICIPAYKQPVLLKRLLDSILSQSYHNIEIIVSDDTPDDSVAKVTQQFQEQMKLLYFHHRPALKSPANWNYALDKASGDFIMLIHQDDWLASSNAIGKYVEAFQNNPFADFIFSKNTPVHETGEKETLLKNDAILNNLNNKPDHLLILQVIGPPSNVMVRKNVRARYDKHFIWLVDVDYYSTVMRQNHKAFYLDEHLINIGLHGQQTTVFCLENPDIILRENIYYAVKRGNAFFNDVRIFDYYWRFMRNNSIRERGQIIASGISEKEIPAAVSDILKAQKNIPRELLKIGLVSKTLMMLCYLKNKKKYR